MASQDESDWRKEYERNSSRAHIAGYVLVGGLVLGIVNSVIWFHGVETLVSIVAALLITGAGWRALVLEGRARKAGDKQLAQYEARTAEANERAVQAQLSLERIKADEVHNRARSQTDRQSQAIQTSIAGCLPNTLGIFYLTNDVECQELARQFANAFRRAGWSVELVSSFYRGAELSDIWLDTSSHSSADQVAIRQVNTALSIAKVACNFGKTNMPSMWPPEGQGHLRPAVMMHVGPRPRPLA